MAESPETSGTADVPADPTSTGTDAAAAPVAAPVASFQHLNLSGSIFREVGLRGASFDEVGLSGATFRESDLSKVRMIGVMMMDAVIEGDVAGLVINGVEVAPLVEAELDRRNPGRERLRSHDPDELRAAWAWLEELWAATTAAALERPEEQLRLRIADEWSFLETLRHLVMATDSWLAVGVLGRTEFHPLGLSGPWLDPATCGLDATADPTVAEVLEARASRQQLVRDYLATATRESLAESTSPPPDAGWPPVEAMPALERIHVILDEEWWHLQFAERDMAAWPTAPA